jgi:hypothetical protein
VIDDPKYFQGEEHAIESLSDPFTNIIRFVQLLHGAVIYITFNKVRFRTVMPNVAALAETASRCSSSVQTSIRFRARIRASGSGALPRKA